MQARLAQIDKQVVDMEKFVLGTSSPLAMQALQESSQMVRAQLAPYEQAIRKLGEAHQAILVRVVDVEKNPNSPSAPLFGDMFGSRPQPLSGTSVDVGSFAAMVHQVTQMQIDVDKMKTKSADCAVKWMNLGFTSIQDVSAFVRTSFDASCFGLIIDVLLLLECIAEERETQEGSAAGRTTKQLKQLKELNLATKGEARALAVLETTMPRLLYKGEPSAGEKDP